MIPKKRLLKVLTFLIASISSICMMIGCSTNQAEGTPDDSYVLVTELEFINQSIQLREDGTYIYQAQIKNNSDYIIRGISIEIKLDNGNYTTIATQDTLRPGDISGYVECFGPDSGRTEDMKATRILINMYDQEMVHTIIEYDVNQNKYTYTEGDPFSNEEPKVLVNQLEFVNPTIKEGSNEGDYLFETSIKNNSDYSIMGLVYTFEVNESKTVNLMVLDTINPKESTGIVSCTGPDSGNLNDMKIKTIKYSIVDEKGNPQTVTYDIKLEQYFIK